jgi:hypothetical protein
MSFSAFCKLNHFGPGCINTHGVKLYFNVILFALRREYDSLQAHLSLHQGWTKWTDSSRGVTTLQACKECISTLASKMRIAIAC